ncbi:tryptophan biosynthesis modulator TrpM [Streptomyces griseoaurantiacus]|uniref:tryptophan biosynthesis modulator TrpM n=1 Tax=Streptomyces griseoaurantiacus TaxID=68213 RepID=UPI0036AD9B44
MSVVPVSAPAVRAGEPVGRPRIPVPCAHPDGRAPAGAAGTPCTPAPSARDPYARLARGCRPRGCRAPARRVHGRRVRYVIGAEPGQVNGMRWHGAPGARRSPAVD